jgi:hypothetical protein
LHDFRADPLLGQAQAVKEVVHYLRTLRVSAELLEPLEILYTDLVNELAASTHDRPGPAPAPFSRRLVTAYASATVTVLKGCGWKVGDAIA